MHNSCFGKASLDVFQALIKNYSDIIKIEEITLALPLNSAYQNNTSLEVIQGLVVTNFDATKVHDEYGNHELPLACHCNEVLHFAYEKGASLEVC